MIDWGDPRVHDGWGSQPPSEIAIWGNAGLTGPEFDKKTTWIPCFLRNRFTVRPADAEDHGGGRRRRRHPLSGRRLSSRRHRVDERYSMAIR